jgi:hypothetical protein
LPILNRHLTALGVSEADISIVGVNGHLGYSSGLHFGFTSHHFKKGRA